MSIAADQGVPKAANTALLGAMMELGLIDIPEEDVLGSLADSFSARPKLVEVNRKVYASARDWARENLTR